MEVFPCVPKGKAPLTPNGFYDATTDTTQIQRWWTSWPNANIGYRIRRGILVVDVDPRNGGTKPEGLPSTRTALTGGGGYHFYYSYDMEDSGGNPRFRATASPGVDLKTSGYVLLAPSYTDSEYRWTDGCSSNTILPQELYKDWLKDESIPLQVNEWVDDPSDTRPGTLYNREAIARGEEFWRELLEPEGWTIIGRADGETYWCRPGKSGGISATTNYQGSGLLYVFSSNSIFEPEKAYNPFAAYAALLHDSDYTAAARSISETGGDVPLPMDGVIPDYREPNIVVPEYHYTSPFPEDHFVSRFVEYVAKQTDAPREYGEAAALSLLSLAGYRTRSALAPYPGGLSGNLYVVLVGPTTRSRKSTVQRIAGSIAKAVMPPALLPNRATTEGLISALASRNGVPSIWLPDEFGVTLAEMYQRDFMKGLEEMLLTVYSGDDYEYKRSMDTLVIRQPSLSVLGAATPESISRAGTTALDSGLLPRFAVVYPNILPEPRVVSNLPEGLAADRAYFISKLNAILTWSNTHEEITFNQDALTLLNMAEQSLTNTNSTARLPTMLYKVAALCAVSETRSVVEGRDAVSAISVINRWAEGMKNLVPQMYRHGTDQQFEQQMEYALNVLTSGNGSLPRSTVANQLNVRKARMDEIEYTLVDKGRIVTHVTEGVKWWHLK